MDMKKIIDFFLALKPYFFPNSLFLLGFIIVDFIWLRSLPKLNISYGSGSMAALMISFIRVNLFIFWIIIQFAFHRIHFGIPHFSAGSFLVVNLLILGVSVYGFCFEPFHLTQSRLQVRVPQLDHTVRIVQLSDIHVERTTKRELELPAYIEYLHPDMIVITGDLISEQYITNPVAEEGLRLLISKLHAPLGIYVVNGNVESPSYLDELLEGLNVRVLHNEVVHPPTLGDHFDLVGLDFVDWDLDQVRLNALLPQVKPDDFSLLLYHTPDLIYTASDKKVNLYLAGHTHGGQIRLPFYGALFANSRYGKQFEMGEYKVNHTLLFVSRGLGFTGGIAPRMRFLAPPEIVIIDLSPNN